MKSAYLTLTSAIAGMFLIVSCAPPSAGTGGSGDPVAFALVTVAAAETAQAVSYQQTVEAVNATAQAAAAVAAVATADAQATVAQATVVSADMTQVAVAATATEDKRLSNIDDQRVAIELEARQSDLAAADQINQQIVADNQKRLDDEAARRAQEAQIALYRSVVLIVLLALVGLAIVALLAAIILDRIHRMKRREEALRLLREQGQPSQPTITKPAQAQITAGAGRATAAHAQMSITTLPQQPQQRIAALPPNQRTAVLQQAATVLSGKVANWQEFSRWNTKDRMVVGVGLNGPIVFDLALLPHIFTAGMTRKGKSTLLRVLLAYMATSGYNVVVLNERSSDFSGLALPNVMNLRGFSEPQRLRMVQETFAAAILEMNRRDGILHAAGVPTWRAYLEQQPHETPLMFLFVDEFLELTQGNRSVRNDLMTNALTLSSQAGKFGIGIGLNATDPTQRALGDIGYSVIQNCARICLGVNTTYASMSVLGDGSAFGLPAGQFVAIDHNGERHAGIGFNPTAAQLQSYIQERAPQAVRPFPVSLTAVSRSISEEEAQEDLDTADPELSAIIEDSRIIATLTGSGRIGRSPDSRSAICEILYEQGHIGWGRTGPNVRRVEMALMYLSSKGDGWARGILERSRSTAVTPEETSWLNRTLKTNGAAATD